MKTLPLTVAALVAFTGCAARPPGRAPLSAQPSTPTSRNSMYAAVLTWTDYDGWNNPDRALYLLNGEQMGTGESGFRATMERLRKLPAGSWLLIYPVGYFGLREHPGLYTYLPPFWQHYSDLEEATKHLHLSARDEDEFGRWARPELPKTRRSISTRPATTETE